MQQTITIHASAPTKPVVGQTCNGCGVCCAAAPCPVSLALLKQTQQACLALQWNADQNRYFCGMVISPAHYLRWLPASLNPIASRIFKRWIAADQACDSDAELLAEDTSEESD